MKGVLTVIGARADASALGDGVPQAACPEVSRRCNYPSFAGCQDKNTCTGSSVRRLNNGSSSALLPCLFCGGGTSREHCPVAKGCSFTPGHCNKEFCCTSADLDMHYRPSGPAPGGGERGPLLGSTSTCVHVNISAALLVTCIYFDRLVISDS